MSDPIPAVEHAAETIAADAVPAVEHAAETAVPEAAQVAADAHEAEAVAAEVEHEAPAAERVVASVSRNADGTIREAGARLVGDREELVRAFHAQLVSVAGRWHEVEALLRRAEDEVDAMLHGHRPPAAPLVDVSHPNGAPVVNGPANVETPAP